MPLPYAFLEVITTQGSIIFGLLIFHDVPNIKEAVKE